MNPISSVHAGMERRNSSRKNEAARAKAEMMLNCGCLVVENKYSLRAIFITRTESWEPSQVVDMNKREIERVNIRSMKTEMDEQVH